MNEIAKTENRRPMISAADVNPVSMMFDPAIAERVHAIAMTMAKGTVTVPEHLRGNVGDCLAIVMQAASWRLNPFAVAQKTHIVSGTLGYEAQLVNAVVNSLRLIEGRFRYEYEGDWKKTEKRPRIQNGRPSPGWSEKDEEGLAIVVSAKLRGEAEPSEHRLALASVWPRNSPLWAIAPTQQISYLAVKQWTRKFCPDAILGVYTVDEIERESMQTVEITTPNDDAAKQIMARAKEIEQRETVLENVTAAQEPESKSEPEPEPEPEPDEEWPQERGGELVDCRGVPWHKDLYSARKTCTDAGTWRKRRGASQAEIDRHEARYVAKVESGGTATAEPEPEPELDDGPPQNEQRTVSSFPTEREMTKRIKRATGTAELDDLIEMIVGYEPWEQVLKDRLVALAQQFRADWEIVEKEERERQ